MARRADADVAPSLLVVDKPAGLTSHDVVGRVRRLAGTRRVGHAGTLDPMATGVLVLGIGRATRLLTHLVGLDKEYTATIRLGQATVTDDAEGEILAAEPGPDPAAITGQRLDAALARLTGDIEQVPSAVSAIKVDGERAYARVRSGEHVELAARPVTVHRLQALDTRAVTAGERTVLDVDVVAAVSSGTYIRALARDLGRDLGVGGHLTALRRTRVGPFGVDGAHPLDDLLAAGGLAAGGVDARISPAAAAQRLFPVRQVDREEATALGHGRSLSPTGTEHLVAALGPEGDLVALLQDTGAGARPILVLTVAQ